MAEDKIDNNQVGELMHQGLEKVQVNLSSVFYNVQVFKLGQKITTSLPGPLSQLKRKFLIKCGHGGNTSGRII